jgi:hypothetical protein
MLQKYYDDTVLPKLVIYPCSNQRLVLSYTVIYCHPSVSFEQLSKKPLINDTGATIITVFQVDEAQLKGVMSFESSFLGSC